MRRFLLRLLNGLRPNRAESDLDREVTAHLAMLEDEYRRRGMTPDDARTAARRALGGIDRVKERHRDARSFVWLDDARRDAPYALRSLARNPGFTAVAVFTLALGIGATTTMFSVVHAVMLRPLPYPEADRLFELTERNRSRNLLSFSVSALNFQSWADRNRSFEALFAYRGANINLTDGGDPERVSGAEITASIVDVLRLPVIAGHPFGQDDQRPGNHRVALLAESLWRRRYGSDPALLGRSIAVNGEPYQVVGIVPSELGVGRMRGAQVFVPMVIDPPRERRGNHTIRVVGRLRAGMTLERAHDDMTGIARALAQEYPESNAGWDVNLTALHDTMVDRALRRSLVVMLGAAGLVLLLACANIANLLLARGTGRRRELAIRTALGATNARLVRQLLTESLCLAAVSGGCGIVISWLALDALRAVLPETLPRADEISVDRVVLGFGLLLSFISVFGFALVPAARVGRVRVGSTRFERTPLRHGLVIAQTGIATLLFVGAALLLQSFMSLQRVPVGFDPEGVMTARITLPRGVYSDPRRIADFYQRLTQAFDDQPHVRAAGLATTVPFGPGARAGASVEGGARTRSSVAGDLPVVEHMASPGYFAAAGIPIRAGRPFGEQDRSGAPVVAIVSESAAAALWPAGDPVGQVVTWRGTRVEVIGVSGDVRGADGEGPRGGGLDRQPRPALYLSSTQFPQITMTLVVRADTARPMTAGAIREVVRRIDPAQPVYDARSLQDWVTEGGAQPRLSAMVTAIFAGLAVTIAAAGIYGVLAYVVAQRTREIGIRMALGAQRAEVFGLVLRQSAALAAAGIALGLAGAAGASRWLEGMLFGITPLDAATFIAVPVVFALVALLASYGPARRATRVDPLIALRCE